MSIFRAEPRLFSFNAPQGSFGPVRNGFVVARPEVDPELVFNNTYLPKARFDFL